MDSLVERLAEDVFAATSFTILHKDENGKVKIRRGEDWRRCTHNATIRAWDVPTHHMAGDFAAMARRMTDAGDDLHVFGHDLLNVYRQWPVRHPSHNATFLRTKHGLTLWFHLAMCFGATASVWNFNRVADALQLLTRMLLLLAGGHYMDDFNGVEYAEHSDSDAFSEFFHILGLRVKDSKAQPPASKHVIQGVEVQVRQDGVELCPTPRRVAKLRHAIAQALESNSLTPPEAGRLAGKLSFLTQAVFGAVGRAALQPVYATAHNTQTDEDQSLSTGLRSALYALAHILDDVKPRFLPNLVPQRLQAVIFADAYVKTGKQAHKAGHVPHDLPLPACARDNNGWGYVVRIGEVVYFDHFTTPRSVLDAITSRRAFWRCTPNLWRSSRSLHAYHWTGWRSSITRLERLPSKKAMARTPS